ncbi:MAG: DUF302 domain-containing protein [Bacteroidota bacterium]
MKYYIEKELDSKFEDAVEHVKGDLKANGFGVLSEINLQEKFKEKLDVDFRKYTILGACNPQLAHRAITIEINVGTLLPCSVVVQETTEGKVNVAAIDPVASMSIIENEQLKEIAEEVKSLLTDVILHL